jgi:hypothetical protein
MDVWSRIPIVTLVLGTSCQGKSPDWPPVECGEMTCLPGEFCLVYPNDCYYIDVPCESYGTTGYSTTGDSTTGCEREQCIHVEPGPMECTTVPRQCKFDRDGIASCLESDIGAGGFCSYGGVFAEGTLTCNNGFYGECGIDGDGPRYDYCQY